MQRVCSQLHNGASNSARNLFSRAATMSNTNGTPPSRGKVLTMQTLNPNIKEMQYAVRGPIVARAGEIEKELQKGAKRPYEKIIRANIGDCHAVGQEPLTFLRQVIALCAFPKLLKSDDFPADAKNRARRILEGCRGGSIGSYSDSPGIEVIRRDIAKYIEERDGGIACDYKNIFLSTGASDSIKSVLKMMMTARDSPKTGIMLPIPQYPLYTATLSEYGGVVVPYYLNEDNAWALETNELQRSIDEYRGKCEPRGIVVINPGNPTGSVLTRKNIEEIIKFAHKENLFILADEVYQHNVYQDGAKFYSFKKVLTELGEPYSHVELASFMSSSKGFMGECGFRGGYCEAINMDPDVFAQLMKSISAKLCPNVTGQAAMDVVVNPPLSSEPSHDLFMKEKNKVLGDLNEKAKMTTKILNSIPGISCNEVAGAMYAFPKLDLPPKLCDAAKKAGQEPDAFYCFQLLEDTGICVVPGSGFGQKPGTFHFRMTILPPVNEIQTLLERLQKWHVQFLANYN